MSLKPNKKGVTYIQDYPPNSNKVKQNESWFNTLGNQLSIWDNGKWEILNNNESGIIASDFVFGNLLQKIDFTYDLTNVQEVKKLNFSYKYSVGLSSSTFGYIFGGSINQIDKFSLNNFLAPTTLSISLKKDRHLANSCSSKEFGYICDNIKNEKFTYILDSTELLTSSLANEKLYGGSCNSSSNGYFFGGNIITQNIDIFNFETETTSILENFLNTSKFNTIGTNSSTHGYIIDSQNIEKFNYSFLDGKTTSINYISNKINSTSLNSISSAYICGGYQNEIFNLDITSFFFSFDNSSIKNCGYLGFTTDNSTGHSNTNLKYFFT